MTTTELVGSKAAQARVGQAFRFERVYAIILGARYVVSTAGTAATP